MFKAVLFTIVKTCQQSKCPSTNKCTKKIWYSFVHTHTHTHTHTMEYYSAIKKNVTMLSVAIWICLEIIILSELSQKEKDKYHMISLVCGL